MVTSGTGLVSRVTSCADQVTISVSWMMKFTRLVRVLASRWGAVSPPRASVSYFAVTALPRDVTSTPSGKDPSSVSSTSTSYSVVTPPVTSITNRSMAPSPSRESKSG